MKDDIAFSSHLGSKRKNKHILNCLWLKLSEISRFVHVHLQAKSNVNLLQELISKNYPTYLPTYLPADRWTILSIPYSVYYWVVNVTEVYFQCGESIKSLCFSLWNNHKGSPPYTTSTATRYEDIQDGFHSHFSSNNNGWCKNNDYQIPYLFEHAIKVDNWRFS